MSVAAVARRFVQNPSLFDGVLADAWPEFANFSTLIDASVWPDHLRCATTDSIRCQGTSSVSGIRLFDTWHFQGAPYVVGKPELPPLAKLLPLSAHGVRAPTDAVSALASAHQTVSSGALSSLWSWNLLLRLVLHLVGDLHQPCHAGSLYAEWLPKGDYGANLILLRGLDMPGVKNLHSLWDAGGGKLGHYPRDMEELERNVDRLLQEHTPEAFVVQGRLNQAWKDHEQSWGITEDFFQSMALDTFSMMEHVYSEYLKQTKQTHSTEFTPSAEYISQVEQHSESQIALGGYRLSSWLNAVEKYLPPQDIQDAQRNVCEDHPNKPDDGPSWRTLWQMMACSAVCGGLFAAVAILGVQSARGAHRRRLSLSFVGTELTNRST